MTKEKAEEFKETLEEELGNIAKEQRGAKEEWTEAIKKCLVKIAQRFELSSNCHLSLAPGKSYPNHDNHEWLCDVMLYKASEKGIEEVILCAESEWCTDEDEIFWDFSKLLVIKSKFHLMVFNAPKRKYEHILQKLEDYLDNSAICTKDKETFFFAAYQKEDNEELRFKEHKWK